MTALYRVRRLLQTSLDQDRRRGLARFQATRLRGLQRVLQRSLMGSNLKALAMVNNSDKWGGHWYAQHYETHFGPRRREALHLLEIGVGGNEDPRLGGGSLRMWRTYFPNARVFGIDIHDKSAHDESRIKTFRGSQADEAFLEEVVRTMGRIDIVIDDGSHQNEHVLRSFRFLFPRLSANGLYVIEDTQTSYWERYGGSSTDLMRPDTVMVFLKSRMDGLNHAEFETPDYEPSYFDRHIVALHFYHNIAFIQKGLNDEGSNLLPRAAGHAQWSHP